MVQGNGKEEATHQEHEDDPPSWLTFAIIVAIGPLGLVLMLRIMEAVFPWMPNVGFLMGDGTEPVPIGSLVLRYWIMVLVWLVFVVLLFALMWLAAGAYIIVTAAILQRMMSVQRFRQVVAPLRKLPVMQKLTDAPLTRMLEKDANRSSD